MLISRYCSKHEGPSFISHEQGTLACHDRFYQEENEVKGGCQGTTVLSEWRTSEWDFQLAEFDGGRNEI